MKEATVKACSSIFRLYALGLLVIVFGQLLSLSEQQPNQYRTNQYFSSPKAFIRYISLPATKCCFFLSLRFILASPKMSLVNISGKFIILVSRPVHCSPMCVHQIITNFIKLNQKFGNGLADWYTFY